MRETSAGHTTQVAGVARAILWGTGTAGLLDLAFSLTAGGLRGSTPVRVLQGVATGLFGRDAFYGGVRTALVGLLLFWVIILGAAVVYALTSRGLGLLGRHPVVCGLLYGAAVNLFVSQVVVPLSAASQVAGAGSLRLLPLVGCAVFVGLPIALAMHRFAPAPQPAGSPEPAARLLSSNTTA